MILWRLRSTQVGLGSSLTFSGRLATPSIMSSSAEMGATEAARWRREMTPEGDQRHVEPNALLAAPLRVINVGLESFADNLASQGVEVVHVRWAPPAGGDAQLASLLAKLQG